MMANEVNNVIPEATVPNKNMTTCKSCGASIAKKAKTCPACGAKNKKPIYKRPWFIVLAAIIVIAIIAGIGGGDNTASSNDVKNSEATTAAIEYTEVSIDTLLAELDDNAYNAQQKYKNMYVIVTGGEVETIDASGEYFSINCDYNYGWDSIHVSIPSSIKDSVMSSISSDASVTIKGKITEVGEILGYTMDAEEVTIN